MVRLVLSPENPNRPSEMDVHHIENGPWEKAGGRRQGMHIARAFVKHVRIPMHGHFSLLDLGCALGDSIPVLHEAYPEAELHGSDVSSNAVRRCQSEFGHIASFFQTSIHELDRSFDVIFCSNLIEHIENYIEMVEHLLNHAKIVYVMVPYMELNNGERLDPRMGLWHVATFDEHTLDPLKDSGFDICTYVFRVPGAWGHPLWKIPMSKLKHALLGRPYIDRKQIVFELKRLE